MGFGFDETAHGKKTEAVVLAVCVDPLDALAQGGDGLARFARHALPPRLEAGGLASGNDKKNVGPRLSCSRRPEGTTAGQNSAAHPTCLRKNSSVRVQASLALGAS